MLNFPINPHPGAVYIARDFGGLLFRYDGQRWMADAADVLEAFERMAADRELIVRERVVEMFFRFGYHLPPDAVKELGL